MSKIKVQSAREGFRRAGYSFGREPVVIDVSELPKEHLEALRNDPMLVVVDLDDSAGGSGAAGKTAAKTGVAKAAEKEAADKAAADKAAADKAAADKAAADKAAADKANGTA